MNEPGAAQNLRYEISSGIRKPLPGDANAVKGRKVRGVVYEMEAGGGIELWNCGHDHAPGIKDMRQVSDEQCEAAYQCAERWIAEQMANGHQQVLPVVREQ